MFEISQSAVIGFDDFLREMEEKVKPEYGVNPEMLLQDLICQAENIKGGTIGCVVKSEFTKENQDLNYLFSVNKEDSMFVINYIGCTVFS